MRLIQIHRNGYSAPTIYKDEEAIKDMLKKRQTLSTRFPDQWHHVIAK